MGFKKLKSVQSDIRVVIRLFCFLHLSAHSRVELAMLPPLGAALSLRKSIVLTADSATCPVPSLSRVAVGVCGTWTNRRVEAPNVQGGSNAATLILLWCSSGMRATKPCSMAKTTKLPVRDSVQFTLMQRCHCGIAMPITRTTDAWQSKLQAQIAHVKMLPAPLNYQFCGLKHNR